LPVYKYKSLGDLIRNERKNKGLTQLKLADLIGTDNSHISKWERDENYPSDKYIPKLANTLSIPEEVLERQIKQDKWGFAIAAEEPAISYSEKSDIIKNLEAIQQIIKITIDKLKQG